MRKLALLMAILLALCSVAAQGESGGTRLEDARTQIGENVVAYPQLTGLADETIERRVNDDILLSSDAARYLVTLATLGQSPWGLQMDYTAFLRGDVLSVAFSAKGKQPDGRNGHVYTALTYDLRTGERLKLSDLFADVNGAVAYMEGEIALTLADEVNGYFQNGDLTPLPAQAFTLDEDGVTFWYPYEQFAFLSEFSGAVQFDYCELWDFLKTDEDSVAARVEALPKAYAATEAKTAIEQAVTQGKLPHVPVALGDKMTEIAAQYRLLRTPDEYPGGRYYTFEAAKLRGALVISDAMTDGYEQSVVEGLRLRRGEIGGLLIGKAAREDWLRILGEPDEAIVYTESMAYDNNLPVGQSDIYAIAGRQLRLHADADGTLCCVQLND